MNKIPSSKDPVREHLAKRRRIAPPLLSTAAGQIAGIAMGTALLAVSILIPAIYLTPAIPLTFQILALCLVALLFGPRTATSATGLYVLLGVIGLPIFANFRSGPAVLAGPTGGYLVGYIFAAAIIGVLGLRAHQHIRRQENLAAISCCVIACLAGILVIHILGILGMVLLAKLSWSAAFTASAVFFPVDILKAVLASLIAVPVLRTFRRFLLTRR